METKLNWTGVMVEKDAKWLSSYKSVRPNSHHIIGDATQLNYKQILNDLIVSHHIDYLQLDLMARNATTLKALEQLDATAMDTYKFATVTFEHNIKMINRSTTTPEQKVILLNTLTKSLEIFTKRGYVLMFKNIHIDSDVNEVYEDWWVHPELVDMDYVNQIIKNTEPNYVQNHIT